MFRRSRFEFADTYSHFGTIPTSTKISATAALVTRGRIWVAITDQNKLNFVASAPLDGRNLLSPDSWVLEQPNAAGSLVTSLAVVGGTLYAGTTTGMSMRDSAGWSVVSAFQGRSIEALTSSVDHLLLATSLGEVFSLDKLGAVQQVGSAITNSVTSLTTDTQGNPVAGVLNGGILTVGSGWVSHYPNGPNSNEFISVAVDPNGVVWGATGSTHGSGINRFDGSSWTSFTTQNSVVPSNDMYRVSVTPDGSAWGSSWGRGTVEFPGGRTVLDSAHIFNTNVGMVGLLNDLSFIVPANVVADGQGNTWLSVLLSATLNGLMVRRPDLSWKPVPVIYNGKKITNIGYSSIDKALAVDGSDNLWLVSQDGVYSGVIGLNNGGRVDSLAPYFINQSSGLPSNNVSTIVIDRDNMLWVGTDHGIAILADLANPLASDAILAYKPLLGTTVTSIAVDPLNQKWVGTNAGVVLLSPDGTDTLANFTAANTNGRLTSDNVLSIAIDAHSGTIYFGTSNGLVSLTTAFAAPSESAGRLLVYPNPFRVPSDIPLTIDGLARDSQIKILSIDGSLVRSLTTPGGRIGFWDGRNESGTVVASGIYLVIGYTDDGSAVTGKVAVLRK